MTVYVSKPTECEARRWCAEHVECIHAVSQSGCAERIVRWVNANGGDACFRPDPRARSVADQSWVIAIRTINGWAYAEAGAFVVMGSATFETFDYVHDGYERTRPCRDFYPCDPETFESRWQPRVGHPRRDDAAMSADVERLRELAEAATPGPWEYEDEWATETVYHPAKVLALGEVDYWSGDSNEYVVAQGGPGDMALIAAANPATVLALLAELTAARSDNEELQARWQAALIALDRPRA